MNKRNILALLLLIYNAPALCQQCPLEELFPELKLYMVQFLQADSIVGTLRNILNLYLTNKQFKTIIDNNPQNIKDLIYTNFKTGPLNKTFLEIISQKKFKDASLFLRFDIVSLAKAVKFAVIKSIPEWINYLYTNGILKNDYAFENDHVVEDPEELLTPLGVALLLYDYDGAIPVLEAILAHGGDVNKFSNKRTALQAILDEKQAPYQKNLDVFKFLLERGADPLRKNSDGTTILDYIEKYYQSDAILNHYIALLKEGKYAIPATYEAFRTGMRRKVSNFRMARLATAKRKA